MVNEDKLNTVYPATDIGNKLTFVNDYTETGYLDKGHTSYFLLLNEDQKSYLLKQLEHNMKERGADEETIQAEVEKNDEAAREEALQKVRVFFVLDKIAGDQKIFVTEGDVDVEFRNIAAASHQGVGADATVLVAGQRAGGVHRLYMVYSPGNFIEATPDTPFLQAGEHKYGKPVLDRLITPQTPLEDASKAVFVSMDSTLRSNLSVGMPLDLTILPTDALSFSVRRRVDSEDEDWKAISASWSLALSSGFQALPPVAI